MSTWSMLHRARNHWAEWLPTRVAELKEAGELEHALRFAA